MSLINTEVKLPHISYTTSQEFFNMTEIKFLVEFVHFKRQQAFSEDFFLILGAQFTAE